MWLGNYVNGTKEMPSSITSLMGFIYIIAPGENTVYNDECFTMDLWLVMLQHFVPSITCTCIS